MEITIKDCEDYIRSEDCKYLLGQKRKYRHYNLNFEIKRDDNYCGWKICIDYEWHREYSGCRGVMFIVLDEFKKTVFKRRLLIEKI